MPSHRGPGYAARHFSRAAPGHDSVYKHRDALMLLPTCLVGSYPQPDWLIDRERLSKQVPRVRLHDLWRVEPDAPRRGAGRRHAARHPRPGARRPRHHHRRRAAARELLQPLRHRARRHRPRQSRHDHRPHGGNAIPVPRVVGKIRRKHPVEVRDVQFLRANTDRTIKTTVPGPFTMGMQAQDDFYGDDEKLAMDYAAAVNAEIKDLFAAGADIVQIDEPWMQSRRDKARQFGIKALDRALDGVKGTIAMHLCFGYAAVVHDKPAGYSFLPEFEQSRRARSRSRRRSPSSISRFCSNCRRRPSSSA